MTRGAPERVVVVGAGLAGLRAAQSLRAEGFSGELGVVGAERHPPYTRPPLSKGFLTGAAALDDCLLAGPDELDAHWRLDTAAVALDLGARVVVLADGRRLPFDGLVVATGADARPWPAAAPPQALTLRNADDAERLRDALASSPRRVLVVGAGFIGSEVASSAAELGHAVVLVEIEAQPLARLLGPSVGELVAAAHRAHGVDLRTATTVERFASAEGAAVRADLSDGSATTADLCVIALGAVPATGWLAGSGLALARDGAVLCAADLSVRGDDGRPLHRIVAAGDLARWPHPRLGGESLALGHWTNAAAQGEHAARTLLAAAGAAAAFDDVPTFWSTIHDVKLRSVGVPALGTDVRVLEGDPAALRGVLGYVRSGRLVGALSVNAGRRALAYRERIGTSV